MKTGSGRMWMLLVVGVSVCASRGAYPPPPNMRELFCMGSASRIRNMSGQDQSKISLKVPEALKVKWALLK